MGGRAKGYLDYQKNTVLCAYRVEVHVGARQVSKDSTGDKNNALSIPVRYPDIYIDLIGTRHSLHPAGTRYVL